MAIFRDKLLFSKQPVNKSNIPPVVIIGLPRSGSSFLAHITSHLDDWFIFDDLYLYREAKAINAVSAPLNPVQLDKLIFFLGWQIRARINFGVFCKPNMSTEEVEKMNNALKDTFRNIPVYWHELQEEWMMRLSLNQGCKYWGYKAPQDFQITNIIDKAYPGTKYIFLYRDPRRMLRSFKYVRDQDGNPEQYHPVIYSYYWKKALNRLDMLTQSIPDRILAIKYEDLVSDPHGQADIIASYLKTNINKSIEVELTNSSFSSSVVQDITDSEKRICEVITDNYLNKYGYTDREGKMRLRDIPDLIKSTFIFSFFQLKRIITSKSARVSVLLYIKSIFRL